MVRIITVQARGALTQMRRRGYLAGDGRRTDRDFRPAYRVMREWLAHAIPGYDGSPYPVWGWSLEGRPGQLDNLVGHLEGVQQEGVSEVVLAAEVESGRALRTCFDCWHGVLNGHPIGEAGSFADAAWLSWLSARGRSDGHPVDVAPEEVVRLLKEDWAAIIDRNCGCPGDGVTQVTVPWVKRNEVCDAVALTPMSDARAIVERITPRPDRVSHSSTMISV